jgi:parallel beta-helix repeat protein
MTPATTADAATLGVVWVSPTGTDTATCGSASVPCRTINFGISRAADLGIVNVAAGTYHETVTIDKRVSLNGHSAIIDAAGHNNGIFADGTTHAGLVNSTVRGFVVEHATGEGILLRKVSSWNVVANAVVLNDLGATQAHPTYPECQAQGEVPGDCGEGIHLDGTSNVAVAGNYVAHNEGGVLVSDESGPSTANLIAFNASFNNGLDCGITLPSHSSAGVVQNVIAFNQSMSNGGAGILIAAASATSKATGNQVFGNTVARNGLGGIVIHKHAPAQNLNDNSITSNVVGENGELGDSDAGITSTVGITLFSSGGAISGTIIQNNVIVFNLFGVWTSHIVDVSQVKNNLTAAVAVPFTH